MNLKESISLSCVGACVLSLFSHVQLFTTLWTVAHQAPLSIGFSGQEYWSGLPCPPLGDFPHPRIDTVSPAAPCIEGGLFTAEPPRKPFLLVVSGKTSLTSKESACKECRRLEFNPWVWKVPLEKEMATHSSILAWGIPWTRTLLGYSPWCSKESDTTEWLSSEKSNAHEKSKTCGKQIDIIIAITEFKLICFVVPRFLKINIY